MGSEAGCGWVGGGMIFLEGGIGWGIGWFGLILIDY